MEKNRGGRIMLEVEIKAFLDGLSSEKIAAAAKELGFRKCRVLQETDIYLSLIHI